jgi:hypothetical protein
MKHIKPVSNTTILITLFISLFQLGIFTACSGQNTAESQLAESSGEEEARGEEEAAAEGTCTSNADCEEGFQCFLEYDSKCYIICDSDADCVEPEKCDMASGYCIEM